MQNATKTGRGQNDFSIFNGEERKSKKKKKTKKTKRPTLKLLNLKWHVLPIM